MLRPIVDAGFALGAIHKADATQCGDECAWLAIPVGGQFNVFIVHSRQVAVAAALSGP